MTFESFSRGQYIYILQLGVRCPAQGSHLSRGIEGGENTRYSVPPPPPPDNSCQTWDSNPQDHFTSLSIRPRLPPIFITRSVHNLWCFCHLWSLALFLKKKECQMGFSNIAREAQNKRVYEENYVVELEIECTPTDSLFLQFVIFLFVSVHNY